MEQFFKDDQLGTVRFLDRQQEMRGVAVMPQDIQLLDSVPTAHRQRLIAAIVVDIRIGAGKGSIKRLKLT